MPAGLDVVAQRRADGFPVQSAAKALSEERREQLENIAPSWCPAWPVEWQRALHLVRLHLEARKAAEADTAAAEEPEPPAADRANVTSLTTRRLAHLPPDKRPFPSVAHYDQLLRHRRPDHPTT
ncbi:hypothetical protein [Streptomyces filipinensis]|uniref:hypothetical protein n=1 Tax=Streptomyces TaxID=1883 RepID=UPI0004CDA147